MNPVINQLIADSDQIINVVYPTIDNNFHQAMNQGDKEGMKQALRDIQTTNNRMAEINRMLKGVVPCIEPTASHRAESPEAVQGLTLIPQGGKR